MFDAARRLRYDARPSLPTPMPLKLACPHCGQPTRIDEPYPLPGERMACAHCGGGLTVTYPSGIVDELRRRGKRFVEVAGQASPHRPPDPVPGAPEPPIRPKAPPPPPPPRARGAPDPAIVLEEDAYLPPPGPRVSPRPSAGTDADAATIAPPTEAHFGGSDAPTLAGRDRTVPSARSPYGHLAGNLHEPESARRLNVLAGDEDLPEVDFGVSPDAPTRPDVSIAAPLRPARAPAPAAKASPAKASPAPARAAAAAVAGDPLPPTVRQRPIRRWLARLGCLGSSVAATGGMIGGGALVVGLLGAIGGTWWLSQDLPSVEALQQYLPPTVTMVYDRNGKILGEIFEERRYVVPLEQIPAEVQNAFIAAEDANFWEHGGVDYFGIVRAVGRNAAKGKKAQGASTITQQVARNFLLTNEKTFVRKAKEVLLSWRVESAYDKKHILFLYLNEIYLGSGAYGVEAASRVYFDKPVAELDLAEAALLAGLPPAPSSYSPHKSWRAAKDRQAYVLGQMVDNGYIDEATAAKALAEDVRIAPRTNEFLQQAPHFTEHVRRYLVEKYGEDRVLHEGLQVTTTCDLDLQKLAQRTVTDGVGEVDQRMGFRRFSTPNSPDEAPKPLVVTLPDAAAISARRKDDEKKLRDQWAEEQDPAGRVPLPEHSTLALGRLHDAVVIEVEPKWVRLGIGEHDVILPVAWGDWAYVPDPRRSWKGRETTNFTTSVDTDGDKKPDGAILRVGDVVQVKVDTLDSTSPEVTRAFAGTPGATLPMAGARLWQRAEVEAALMSFDLASGAVRSMVGGADFATSQLNRATQARRQVGSTFKPIVYAAAIDSKKITSGSLVDDAPVAFQTNDDFGLYKPSNYSSEFLGSITLRRALAMSKNTCTVRVLDRVDPGMNQDVIYKFARKLGIGGPPTSSLPEGYVASPDNDHLCPWVKETTKSTICMDHYPPRTDKDSNMGHRAKLNPEDEHWCRACDYSMALGSPSLTMSELMRAYSVFGTQGKLVEPYYVEEVRDRAGNVLEKHEPTPQVQVIDPGVATVANWLLQSVTSEGTAAVAGRLGLHLGGKTGTTNDEKDAWFVGMNPNVITAVWVGFDHPRTLGVSSTGGKTSLPIWMTYMAVAAPKSEDHAFPQAGSVEWANIEESTGRRVASGGRSYPFLEGTAPTTSGGAAGQVTTNDVTDL